jgi:hypothetical protein
VLAHELTGGQFINLAAVDGWIEAEVEVLQGARFPEIAQGGINLDAIQSDPSYQTIVKTRTIARQNDSRTSSGNRRNYF